MLKTRNFDPRLCCYDVEHTVSYLDLSLESEVVTVPLYAPKHSRGAILHLFEPPASPYARVREFLESGYHVLSLPLEFPEGARGLTTATLTDLANAYAALVDEAPPYRSYVSISPQRLLVGADLAYRIGADLICIFPEK